MDSDDIMVCDECMNGFDASDIYRTAYGDMCEPCNIKFHEDMPKHHTEQ